MHTKPTRLKVNKEVSCDIALDSMPPYGGMYATRRASSQLLPKLAITSYGFDTKDVAFNDSITVETKSSSKTARRILAT